jgi:hypothetical protein
MIENDGTGVPPRYEVTQRSSGHYQLWKADCIFEADNRADCQQWAAMLQQGRNIPSA